jgi:hypothetical protein
VLEEVRERSLSLAEFKISNEGQKPFIVQVEYSLCILHKTGGGKRGMPADSVAKGCCAAYIGIGGMRIEND